MKKARLFLVCVLCGLCFVDTATAVTLYVGPGEQYSTIQSAVNAASPGDTISVAAGTYNQSVIVNKRLAIVGSGSANCIVAPSPTSTHVFNVGSGGSDGSIEGFTITSAAPVFSPVNIQGSNVRVTNCKIGGGSFGVTLQGGANNSIASNEIYNSLHHGVLVWANDNEVVDNNIHHTLIGNGVQVQAGHTGNLVRGNTISNCRQYGVYVYGTETTISENTITTNFGGIILGPDANSNHISANTIDNNTDRAIFISSSDNVVDSNKASHNNGHAIIVYAPGARNWINANDVQHSGNNGIQLNWDTTENVVTNNSVQHSGRLALATGIYLTNASRSTVQHNNVGYSSEHGIEMDFDSPHNVIANNVVSYSAAQGILAWECYDGGNEIRDNELFGNGQIYPGNGALQVHGHHNLITGNWVHDNKNYHGIALYPAGQWGIPGSYEYNGLTTHHNDVIGNTVSGPGSINGIVLHTATFNVIKNNTAVSSLARGIFIEAGNSSGNLIYFNEFKGARNLISSVGSSNRWHSLSLQQYVFNGGNFSSYVGNYWSDYSGIDPDGNGVAIPGYDLGDESDSYPLRQGITAYSGATLAPSPTGDYNNDGVVDTADYLVWSKNAGTTNVLPNDPLGGTVGQPQYDQWKARFGHTAGTGIAPGLASGAVPQPPPTPEPTPAPAPEAPEESQESLLTDVSPQRSVGWRDESGSRSFRSPIHQPSPTLTAAREASARSRLPIPPPTRKATEKSRDYSTNTIPQRPVGWRVEPGPRSFQSLIQQSSPTVAAARGANATNRVPTPAPIPEAAEIRHDHLIDASPQQPVGWWEESDPGAFRSPIHQSSQGPAAARGRL